MTNQNDITIINIINVLLLSLNFDFNFEARKMFSCIIKFLYSCNPEPHTEFVVPKAEIKIVIEINTVIPSLALLGNESNSTFKIVVPSLLKCNIEAIHIREYIKVTKIKAITITLDTAFSPPLILFDHVPIPMNESNENNTPGIDNIIP